MIRQTLKTVSAAGEKPIGVRLKLAMHKRGMNSAELAKAADVKTSFIYDIISGKSANPSPIKLSRLAHALGISLGYLAGSDQQREDAAGEYVSISRITADGCGIAVVAATEELPRCHFRRDWIKDQLRARPADLRVVFVRGDGMMPTLCHNDTILIDTTRRTPSPPGIFVMFDGGGLVPKRLETITGKKEPHIRVISDNPSYSTFEQKLAESSIVGRIVWFAREI